MVKKKSPNKVSLVIGRLLLILGVVVVIAGTPFSVTVFTSGLAKQLCVNQVLEDTVVCTPNPIPAFLVTLFVPLLIGTVLIVASLILAMIVRNK